MGALSNTSTLLSTSSSDSKKRLSQNRSSSGTYRYVVGSIGKACTSHKRSTNTNSNKASSSRVQHHQQKNHNVAIATQVLNPRAIGGSLKNRRFTEHFGPSDDDQLSFLNDRQRSACGKLCWYGLSLTLGILMITGLILAVGYMQSEKQKLSTRPVKLAQAQSFEQGRGAQFSYTSTTQMPRTLQVPGTTSPPPIVALDEDDDIDEISLDDYESDEELQKFNELEADEEGNQAIGKGADDNGHIQSGNASGAIMHQSDSDSDAEQDSNEHLYNDSKNNIKDHNADTNSDYKRIEMHNPQEVKVLPPSNFAFDGVSFGFPIYHKESTKSSTIFEGNNDYPNTNKVIDGNPTDYYQNNGNTKDLETSVNEINSNFTSLIDTEDEDEADQNQGLLSLKNYANANNNDNAPVQFSSLSPTIAHITTNSTDSYELTDNTMLEDRSRNFQSNLPISNEKSSQIRGSYSVEVDSGNAVASPDFDILTSAQLQTDIFDDEDFQASASEELESNSRDNTVNNTVPHSKSKERTHLHRTKDGTNEIRKNSKTNYSNDDDQSELNRPRSDPRKLKLKTNNLKPGERFMAELINSEKGPITSHTLPILEYKADFSKIGLPKTSQKIDFQFLSPTASIDPPSELKFDSTATTTPSQLGTPGVQFTFKDFLPGNEYSFPLHQTSPTETGQSHGTLSSDGFNAAHFQTYVPNPTASLADIAPISYNPLQSQQDTQFSKRTYNNFDFDTTSGSSYSNGNSYAHLLGPDASSGSFGSTSANGASLNLFQPNFQPQNQYNFDTPSASNPINSYNIPTGTIPVDLSASYIQATNPTSYDSHANSNPFSNQNSALPYPNLDQTNLQGNPYSFSNGHQGSYGNNNGIPILTTGEGQVPTYNTITQGIHLLSLLSGNNNQGSYPHSGNDQFGSASFQQPALEKYDVSSSNPQYQGLAGYVGSGGQFFNPLENTKFIFPQEQSVPTAAPISHNFRNPQSNGYSSINKHIEPRNNFRSFDSSRDQDSSASFSKAIVSKVAQMKHKDSETSETENAQQPSVFRSFFTSKTGLKETVPSRTASGSKTISMMILPKASSVASTSVPNPIKNSEGAPKGSLTDPESLIPKSRRRGNIDLSSGGETFKDSTFELEEASSEMHEIIEKTYAKNNSPKLRNLAFYAIPDPDSEMKIEVSTGRKELASDNPKLVEINGHKTPPSGPKPGFFL